MKQPDETGKRTRKILITISVLAVAGCFALRWKMSPPVFESVNQELQYLISGFVAANQKTVKNCALAVAKGDGSFSWSGAAGFTDVGGRISMTPKTPIFRRNTVTASCMSNSPATCKK